jgi:hypothetical protein
MNAIGIVFVAAVADVAFGGSPRQKINPAFVSCSSAGCSAMPEIGATAASIRQATTRFIDAIRAGPVLLLFFHRGCTSRTSQWSRSIG